MEHKKHLIALWTRPYCLIAHPLVEVGRWRVSSRRRGPCSREGFLIAEFSSRFDLAAHSDATRCNAAGAAPINAVHRTRIDTNLLVARVFALACGSFDRIALTAAR